MIRALAFLAFLWPCAAAADCQGQFAPVLGTGSPFSQVMFSPKNGNKTIISGREETIPPGVLVMSGGVVGTYNDASIDKVPHQTLKPHTLYFVYVFMDHSTMKMDFSTTGHKEDWDYGNEVHATDPSRSLVGMVRTNGEGRFVGDNKSQLTLSWCNPVRVNLIQDVTGLFSNSPMLQEGNSLLRLEWLQWGVNSEFTQGFDLPTVHFVGTVCNNTAPSYSLVAISINEYPNQHVSGSYHEGIQACKSVTAVGSSAGNGEGYFYAKLLLSNAAAATGTGGFVTIVSGIFYTSPLRS